MFKSLRDSTEKNDFSKIVWYESVYYFIQVLGCFLKSIGEQLLILKNFFVNLILEYISIL